MTFYKNIFFRLLLLLFYAIPLFADIQKLESFSADFAQTVQEIGGKTLNYKGSMVAKAPHFGLWEYKTPINKKVYVIEDSVVVIEPDLEQAIFARLEGTIDFISLSKNAKKVSDGRYKARFMEQEYFITTNKSGSPTKIEFIDKLENKTEILFSNTKSNFDIDKSAFLYEIPQGYDIIRE